MDVNEVSDVVFMRVCGRIGGGVSNRGFESPPIRQCSVYAVPRVLRGQKMAKWERKWENVPQFLPVFTDVFLRVF